MNDDRPDSPRADGRPWRGAAAVAGVALLAFALGFATARSLEDDTDGGELAGVFDDAFELEIGPGSRTGVLDRFEGTNRVPAQLPELELSVHTDGCGVIRTETDEPVPNLTWTILDGDGFQVLGRNALGETRYRYFRPGTYTVVLEAWDGEAYVPVSDEVTIRC